MSIRQQRMADVPSTDAFRHRVTVHASPCYDFVVSLRVLFNPRMYPASRVWGSATRRLLPPDILARGRFFFQGQMTGLGYGALRLIPDLPAGAEPAALIAAVRAIDARRLGTHADGRRAVLLRYTSGCTRSSVHDCQFGFGAWLFRRGSGAIDEPRCDGPDRSTAMQL
jgi:hypothetical protein